MEIDKDLYKEIKDYCVFNDLKPREYIHSLLRKAFNEDRYGKAPFKRAEDSVIGNKAFNDAVDAEVKRILNSPEEFEEIAKKFNRKFFKDTDELDTVMRKFNETFFHGMKEAQETEREISEYMEKNNLEPVSIEELICGEDEKKENGRESAENEQPIKRKRTIKPIK